MLSKDLPWIIFTRDSDSLGVAITACRGLAHGRPAVRALVSHLRCGTNH